MLNGCWSEVLLSEVLLLLAEVEVELDVSKARGERWVPWRARCSQQAWGGQREKRCSELREITCPSHLPRGLPGRVSLEVRGPRQFVRGKLRSVWCVAGRLGS